MTRRQHFSLIEIVVVIAIIVILIGVATVTMRRDSSTAKFEQAVREFEAFTARARMQAMELGRDRVIVFIPADRTFVAGDVVEDLPSSDGDVTPVEVPEEFRIYEAGEMVNPLPEEGLAKLSWTLPADYEFAAAEFNSDYDYDEELEIFRFFPDGAASGRRKFTMQHRNIKKVMAISPLTGLMRVVEEEVL